MTDNPAAPENNLHHTSTFRSLDDFYEQFRYDPDYPSTTKPVDYTKLAWWKEYGNG